MADIYHKRFPCPHCGGSKSLAKYEDGEHCFKCGKGTRADCSLFTDHEHKPDLKWELEYEPLTEEELKFLHKFEIYDDTIFRYGLCHTKEYGGRLALPVWDTDNQVIFVQLRKLDPKPNEIKALSKGPKPLVLFTETGFRSFSYDTSVVVVEDPFSAMKVAMAGYRVFCLYGSSLKKDFMPHFTKLKKPAILWLDGDEAGTKGAIKISDQLSLYTQCIMNFTPEDPKYYSKNEIREILGVHN